MLEAYNAHAAERAALGIPALPLTKDQTAELVKLLKNPPAGKETELVELITNRVPAGVDEAAKVKAEFLDAVAKGAEKSPLISRVKATELLGTMLGGYNIKPLVELLSDGDCGAAAAEALKKTLLMFDYFNDVQELAENGSVVLQLVKTTDDFPVLGESITIFTEEVENKFVEQAENALEYNEENLDRKPVHIRGETPLIKRTRNSKLK